MEFLDGLQCISLKPETIFGGQFWESMQTCLPEWESIGQLEGHNLAAFVYYVRILVTDLAGLSVQMESTKLYMHVSKHEEDLSEINKMLDAVSENRSEFAMAQHSIKSKKTQVDLLTAFVAGISTLSVKEIGNKFWGPLVKQQKENREKRPRKFIAQKLKPVISTVKDMIYSEQKYLEKNSSELDMAQHSIKSKETQQLLTAFVDGIGILSVKECRDKEFFGKIENCLDKVRIFKKISKKCKKN